MAQNETITTPSPSTKNNNVLSAFAQSFSSIVVSELGDKVFLLLCLYKSSFVDILHRSNNGNEI